MKRGKRFVTCTIVCLAAVILCIAGLVSASLGPNPGGGAPGEIVIGPPVKGVLIACWRYVRTENSTDYGETDVFLVVDGKLYTGISNQPDVLDPEQEFLDTIEADVRTYRLPSVIASDFGVQGGWPFIRYDRDVTNFAVKANVNQEGPDPYLPLTVYRHVLHCNVEIWFTVNNPRP